MNADFIIDKKHVFFEHLIVDFVSKITRKEIEIYNEAGIQHELAIYLRKILPDYQIQLERNISYFGLNKQDFIKREMDIVVFTHDKSEKIAIEIKFPYSQVPEQMFSFCKDIKFLEQLKQAGFDKNFFLALTNNSDFWIDKGPEGTIYEKFRKNKILEGKFTKPTGKKNQTVDLNGSYPINWRSINEKIRFFLLRI